MSDKFKLSNENLAFAKSDFIKRRLLNLNDSEIDKIDLGLLEFEYRTLDVMRDAFPKSLTKDEILEAIKIKYERVN